MLVWFALFACFGYWILLVCFLLIDYVVYGFAGLLFGYGVCLFVGWFGCLGLRFLVVGGWLIFVICVLMFCVYCCV